MANWRREGKRSGGESEKLLECSHVAVRMWGKTSMENDQMLLNFPWGMAKEDADKLKVTIYTGLPVFSQQNCKDLMLAMASTVLKTGL